MKKKILEALKNKYKNLGLGEKAIEGAAAFLEPSIKEESDIETAIAGVEPLLKAFQSDTDGIRTAKTVAEKRLAELEAQVKALGGAPETKEDEPETDDDKSTPAWAKALIDSNKKLTERLNSIEGEKISSTRKQKLDAIIGKLPETLRKSYARTPVKDLSEEDFETLTTEISAEVEELVKDNTAKGAVFGRPVGGGQQSKATAKEATDEEANSVVDRFNLG